MSEQAALVGRIVAPLVNPNEPESQVVELGVEPFSAVSRGQVVCTLETSKSTVDVESEHEGFCGEVHVALLDRIDAGQLICEVFDAVPARSDDGGGGRTAARGGPRMTKKAEQLAGELGVDVALLPTDRFVTEREVRELAAADGPPVELDPAIAAAIGNGSVAVYGGGGFGRSLIDVIAAMDGLDAACVIDDNLDPGSDVLGVPVAGGLAVLAALAESGLSLAVNAVGAIGRIQDRVKVSERIAEHGLRMATLVDPAASVATSARLAEGAAVLPQATVWSAASVGRGAIVNTGAIVSHDCRVGDHVHLAPGAILAGHVEVGEASLVGMAVTTRPGLCIGAGAIVGNGAVLTEDVPDGTIVAAGTVWPR